VSIGRVLLFLANEADAMRWPKEMRAQLKGMQRDVPSLSDHSTYLSNKIIKIFSVAAVVLMPPTLVASIYGMNFKNMPELEWPFGYSMALLLMVTVAVLPYLFFKWKKWL